MSICLSNVSFWHFIPYTRHYFLVPIYNSEEKRVNVICWWKLNCFKALLLSYISATLQEPLIFYCAWFNNRANKASLRIGGSLPPPARARLQVLHPRRTWGDREGSGSSSLGNGGGWQRPPWPCCLMSQQSLCPKAGPGSKYTNKYSTHAFMHCNFLLFYTAVIIGKRNSKCYYKKDPDNVSLLLFKKTHQIDFVKKKPYTIMLKTLTCMLFLKILILLCSFGSVNWCLRRHRIFIHKA